LSPHGGRRSLKIVGTNQETDLSVGILNALERGANLEDIRRSYVNAGYSVDEVNLATLKAQGRAPVRKIETPKMQQPLPPPPKQAPAVSKPVFIQPQIDSPKQAPAVSKPVFIQPQIDLPKNSQASKSQIKPRSLISAKPLPVTSQAYSERQETSTGLIVVLLILSLLILVGASILGLYWDRLF